MAVMPSELKKITEVEKKELDRIEQEIDTVPRNLGKSGFDEINPSTAVIR